MNGIFDLVLAKSAVRNMIISRGVLKKTYTIMSITY